MERSAVAAYIDHTLLKPEATQADVEALCGVANELAADGLTVAAVCVSPGRLPLAPGVLRPEIAVTAVCGFPSGAHGSPVKALEASNAVAAGASEIDMVIDLGRALADEWGAVEHDISAVRQAAPGGIVLKVIIESGALDHDRIIEACRVAESAGADFVKTSTGFHPSGGATLEAVELMAHTVDGRLGVKASGGVRSFETAVAMIDAGATRLGTSSTVSILGGDS